VFFECSALPAVLPQSSQLYQNVVLSVLSSTGKTEKLQGAKTCEYGGWGDDSQITLGEKILW
jgi:hypothetical protein